MGYVTDYIFKSPNNKNAYRLRIHDIAITKRSSELEELKQIEAQQIAEHGHDYNNRYPRKEAIRGRNVKRKGTAADHMPVGISTSVDKRTGRISIHAGVITLVDGVKKTKQRTWSTGITRTYQEGVEAAKDFVKEMRALYYTEGYLTSDDVRKVEIVRKLNLKAIVSKKRPTPHRAGRLEIRFATTARVLTDACIEELIAKYGFKKEA